MVRGSDCYAGGLPFESSLLPLLKHPCGESGRPLCWPYTLAKVSRQMWILGNVYHLCLYQLQIRLATLALKPKGDVTRSLKQGYPWAQKWTCVHHWKYIKQELYTYAQYVLHPIRAIVTSGQPGQIYRPLANSKLKKDKNSLILKYIRLLKLVTSNSAAKLIST